MLDTEDSERSNEINYLILIGPVQKVSPRIHAQRHRRHCGAVLQKHKRTTISVITALSAIVHPNMKLRSVVVPNLNNEQKGVLHATHKPVMVS